MAQKSDKEAYQVLEDSFSWHHQLACAVNFRGAVKAFSDTLNENNPSYSKEKLLVEVVEQLGLVEEGFFLVNALLLAVLAKLYLTDTTTVSEAFEFISQHVLPLYAVNYKACLELIQNSPELQHHAYYYDQFVKAVALFPSDLLALTTPKLNPEMSKELFTTTLSAMQEAFYIVLRGEGSTPSPSFSKVISDFLEGLPYQSGKPHGDSFAVLFS
jgi:hypothetical protein